MPTPIPPLLSTPESLLQNALYAQAATDRARLAEYLNLTPRVGSSTTPSRLLSEVGFLQNAPFGYLAPNAAHVQPPLSEEPRTIQQIVIVPYGLDWDLSVIRSPETEDRVIYTAPESGRRGMAVFVPDVLVVADIAGSSRSNTRNALMVRNLTQAEFGPAYHYVIDREGGINVCAPADAKVSPIPSLSDTALFIALEGQLAISRTDYRTRSVESAYEMPYPEQQLTTLAVLIQKLLTAYTGVPRTFLDDASSSSTPGLIYAFPNINVQQRNFVAEPVQTPFDYQGAGRETFLDTVLKQGAFDLATEIWVPRTDPQPTTARADARPAVEHAPDAMRAALTLAAYVDRASLDRASSIERQTRTQIYVQRARVTHLDADQTAAAAGMNNVSLGEGEVHEPAVNPDPHVYNYATGHWGDTQVY
jgi:hypothetical protein